MAKFSVDFTEAKEYTMCGKGEHNFKVTSAEVKDYVKDNETRHKLELTCEVFGSEDSGAKVFLSFFLKNPSGLFMFLNKLGVKVEKKTYSLDTNSFIGKTFVANVEHESYTKSDGTPGNKAVIIKTSIRKYVEETTNDFDDAFDEFANENEITDDDLPFN